MQCCIGYFTETTKKPNMIEVANYSCGENVTLNCPLPEEQQSIYSIPVLLLISLIGILVLVSNGFILVLIVMEKKVRSNPYHFFVLLLSISDFVVGLSIIVGVLQGIIPIFQTSKGVAILKALLVTVAIYLSLYHTFLISLQRCLVICTEKWGSCVFRENRKYFVCVGGWITILINSCIFISPPMEGSFPLDNVNILSFAFNGHDNVFSIYMRFVTMFLLSSTIILYVVSIAFMHRTFRQISPTGQSNASRVIEVNVFEMTEPRPSDKNCKSSSTQGQDRLGQGRLRVDQSNRMATLRRRKVVRTLQLVGLLILVLVIFTGPLVVTLSWYDTLSTIVRGILFGLFGINSMLNPYIYVCKLVDIRGMIKSKLCCFKR